MTELLWLITIIILWAIPAGLLLVAAGFAMAAPALLITSALLRAYKLVWHNLIGFHAAIFH